LRRAALVWLPLVLYSGVIFAVSSLSKPPTPPGNFSDKTLHFGAFFVYGLLAHFAVRNSIPRLSAWLPFFLSALFGASDELHQWFVPGRDCSFLDWLADLSGSSVSIFSITVGLRFWRRK